MYVLLDRKGIGGGVHMSHVSRSDSYKAAGVDVTAGYETIKKIRPMVESTYIKGVLGSIGGFGGMFALDTQGMSEPVLVSGADGVGTKLKIAFALNKHDTIGIDAVAMCVNDIVCSGARPLFFLDYFASGKADPDVASSVVSGMSEGCRLAGCALIGGETAEMPGMYAPEEYDIAGFAVGIVDKCKIIDNNRVRDGDVILGLGSSGLHSNGFSLVRKVLGDSKESLNFMLENGRMLGAELLTPTRIYVKSILKLLESVNVSGICNITGGGWYENIPRMLPQGMQANIEEKAIKIPHIFQLLMQTGSIPLRDMYNTFNMGVGMFIALPKEEADKAVGILTECGEHVVVAGECRTGDQGVRIC